MYILALFFTLVYLAISYRNLALMIHSAPLFPVAALLYLPISLVLTWFAARRLKRSSTSAFGRTIAMVSLGCTLSLAGRSMWWLAITADLQLHAWKEAEVEVNDPMPCLWVPGNFPRDKWEFLLNSELDGTYRLAPLIGAYEPRRETHGRYSQKMFFDGLRKEGLSFCPPEGGSPKRLTAFPGIF